MPARGRAPLLPTPWTDVGGVARVFISYATPDHQLAEDVLAWLVEDGHELFLDHDLHAGLAVGERWPERLYGRLRWADAVVPIVTQACLTSTWCAAEISVERAR
jgi:TIR domain